MPKARRWNGDLVVYAHGYVDPRAPIAIPEDHLSLGDGPTVPEIANRLGYAFAATSYSTNGLAILQGVDDVVDLVDMFAEEYEAPNRVFLVGPSEGGIVTTLAVEQYPEVFAGGLAACGPIGDFQAQMNYWGDFRVLFEYYFPGVLPGDPLSVPEEAIDAWETNYVPLIQQAIADRRSDVEEFLEVAGAPYERRDESTIEQTVLGVLWYNVHATNDGVAKLGGQPFDNERTRYSGSSSDFRLNRDVLRYTADPDAVKEINRHYETTGLLARPLVVLHTNGDPVIPAWHASAYRRKAAIKSVDNLLTTMTTRSYGHCNFTVPEAVVAFLILVRQATGESLLNDRELNAEIRSFLPDDASRAEFEALVREQGLFKPVRAFTRK